MPFQRKNYAGRIDSETEQILSVDFYQHKSIMQAIQSPFKALESGKFSDGLTSVSLSAYLLEKLAWCNDKLKDDDVEFKEFVEKEKAALLNDGIKENSESFNTMISYSKVAFILKRIEEGKSTHTKYKV